MAKINIQMISTEIIKPSSPTPSYLKTFNLSLFDQFAPPFYIPLSFFFQSSNMTFNLSSRLKISLSDTLAKYYPFAGRLTNKGATIDCNDKGIEFFECQVHCQMSQILTKPEDGSLSYLFPSKFLSLTDPHDKSLLAVQVTSFECGGITVALCISHKIADGFSIATFINDWAKVSRGETIFPEFIAMSMQPMEEEISVQALELEKFKCVSKRFVFISSSLDHLKTKASNSGLTNPTRVESVTALLYKTAMSAALSKSRFPKNSCLIQMVNMRSRMCDLPFLENSLGNFVWYFTISKGKDSDKNLNELTIQLREGIVQLCRPNGEKLIFDEWHSEISQAIKSVKVLFDDMDLYRCSSFCRFPFYEVDYGWGNPLWVRMAGTEYKNSFFLMDSRDGHGIEALVTLEEDDMGIFEQDKELLTFASLDPSVV